MKRKVITMKKVLFGVMVGMVCCSVTGCLETQEKQELSKVSEESTVKTVRSKFSRQLEEKETNKKVKKAITLNIKKSTYTKKDKKLIYTIKNTTGRSQKVVLAPKLEKKTKNGYEEVSCITGFCGTADPLKDQIEGSILLDWYPNLSEGTYRLSFRGIRQTKNSIKEIIIKDTFQYE